MLLAKRLYLLLTIPVIPAIMTGASYELAVFVLSRTHRYIAPETIRLVTAIEFCIFVFIAVLNVKGRWAAQKPK